MRISTITTAYDLDEDRLRLAVADAGGQRRVLWLSRRLAERLVPALMQGLSAAPLEADEAAPLPAAPDAAPDAEPQREAALRDQAAQAYAQLEARLATRPAAPVQVGPDVQQGRVNRIELKTGEAGTRGFEFHTPAFEPSELWLTPRELRQWLGLLRAAFQAAEWRQDLWPTWLQAC